MEDDTATMTVSCVGLRRVDAGRLVALADVEITVAGIAFTLHSVRVVRTGPRSRGVGAPCVRLANGRLADAVTLPPELSAAIANLVLDEYEALRRPAAAAVACGTAFAAT